MPSSHVTAEQLDRLRDGSLPPAQVTVVGGHAATCEACGRAVGEVVSPARMTRDLRVQLEAADDAGHLSDDELMAVADGTLHEDAHLNECEICRAEVAEIAEFRGAMRRRRPARNGWMPYAVAASIAAFALTILLVDRVPRTPAAQPRAATTSSPVATESPRVVVAATDPARPEWESWVADVKARRALPVPAVIAELRPQKSLLRGGSEDEDLRLSPDQTVVSLTRPELRWASRAGASYSVILRDGDAIVESGALTDARWKPRHELKRGREYLWQVEVTAGGERSLYPKAPDPPARFRVLEQSALQKIDEVRKQHPEDALLHAVLLARHGLRDETLEAIDRLEGSDAALAADLRESVEGWSR
ncbi:MAG TPA: hypothetical protein VF618_17250 [Thermoanaerobaculia bacterium]